MNSFTVLLNFLDLPTSILKELRELYQHCLNDETQTCNLECVISDEAQEKLKESFIKIPYETSCIIEKIQFSYQKKHCKPFIDIIHTALETYLDNYSQTIEGNSIYSLISYLSLCQNEETQLKSIFTKLYNLIENEKLNKEFIYLSLLPQNNLELLNKFLNYEKLCFNKCNINDSKSLFRYCLYKNKHWLFYFIKNEIDPNSINSNILEKLLFLKLIYFTNNKKSIDYTQILNIIQTIPAQSIKKDRFVQFYITEIKWNIELFRYITKLNPEAGNFEFAELKSCVDLLSEYIDLKNLQNYEEIHEILTKYMQYSKEQQFFPEGISEVDIYNGLSLIFSFESILTENRNEKTEVLLKKIKTNFLQSTNINFQLEIFENIFALQFLQVNNTETDATFICNQSLIHFINTFLKSSLKELKRKYFSGIPEKQGKNYARFSSLLNHVNDALWRLELLLSQNFLQDDKKIVNFMLSSTNTLIFLCLENDNFEKAHEIIEIYKLQETPIAQEIEFIEKIRYLKSEKYNAEAIIKFCTENEFAKDEEFKETVEKYKNNTLINKLSNENETFMNLMDVTLTLQNNYEISKELLEFTQNYKKLEEDNLCPYLKFCYNVFQIFKVVNNNNTQEKLSVPQILNNVKYPLTITELFENQNYYNNLKELYDSFQKELTQFSNTQSCENIFIKLSDSLASKSSNINYLKKLYNYLKSLSNLLNQDCDNIFNLIIKNPANIVEDLIFNQNIQPKDLEPKFSQLKLDLIYYITWNCLPEIEFNTSENSFKKEIVDSSSCLEFKSFSAILNQIKSTIDIQEEKKLIKPDVLLLSYIRKRNWLLAYLFNKIYLIEKAKPDINSDRTKYFNNLLNLKSVQYLKVAFDNNPVLTILHNETQLFKLIQHLETFEQENVDANNWKIILNLINSLPENMLIKNTGVINLKDIVIYNLVSASHSKEICKLVENINNNKLRAKCILENLKNWDGDFCLNVLNNQLTRWDFHEDKNIMRENFYKIELFENIKNVFLFNSWNEVYEESNKDPKKIFLLLLTSKQVVTLLKWIDLYKPTSTNLLNLITINYFKLILEDESNLSQIKTLLDLLQFDHRIQICKNLMKEIRKIDHFEFIVNYLVTLLPELESEYKSIMISLKIFSCFNVTEQEDMFCLIEKPLLIIEQLIMNVRLEKLQNVLDKIRPILKDSEEKNISIDITLQNIDTLLRNYAKKSLDFRGIQPSADSKNLELKLMQSLDSVSVDSERKFFTIPDKVPDKNNWVQNEQALECMCCREVIFSMFNRRHHCRRCGRVICGNCSYKRMEIAEYGSIPVRVCNDCFKQSQLDDQNTQINRSEHSSNKSGSITFWVLNDNEKHNNIVREEFSYEYAPSVSLCLSILQVHSNCVEYPRFLLEECKILLPYLQDAANEIDFSFVIQMIKSLVTVAKMISLHHAFKTELSQCNELLLHIDLLSLLVEKDCLDLLRSTNKLTEEFYIDTRILRRLRDKLLEKEQWHLALEISTKVGLDKTGVFAAWGKNCLRAGCLHLAREKFQYCLEKNTVYETSLDLSVSYDHDDTVPRRSNLKSVTLSTVSESRPAKTPPLVNEIISVLESLDRVTDRTIFKSYENVSLNSSTLSLNTSYGFQTDPAVCILNKLKNLKTLASDIRHSSQSRSRKNSKISVDMFSISSNITITNKKVYIDPIFYHECLYYLMKYASHSTILHFYIRHEEISDALNYVLENRLQSDYFIEIYMKCLEDGKIEILQEHMQKIDITLNSWEVYLKAICRHLEINSLFNVLYHLQLFMCDYVRAAMTCIKFYKENAYSFKELLDRDEYLQKAQDHLKQELEQEQWVQVTRVRKTSTGSAESSQSKTSNQPSLIMKIDPRNIDRYINTIWQQIEIAKFLAECEIDNRPTLEILQEIFSNNEEIASNYNTTEKTKLPTLFDSQLDKTKLAVLALVCGKNIEQGFGIAFRIIQDHNLKYIKIYSLAGKYLSQILRETAVIELIECIRSSGLSMTTVIEICDEVLMVSVSALTKANGTGAQLENLIKQILEPGIKIDAYIESKQLKRAYLLAVRYNRIGDIKKILREAEKHNQPQIKAICMKRLHQTS